MECVISWNMPLEVILRKEEMPLFRHSLKIRSQPGDLLFTYRRLRGINPERMPQEIPGMVIRFMGSIIRCKHPII